MTRTMWKEEQTNIIPEQRNKNDQQNYVEKNSAIYKNDNLS